MASYREEVLHNKLADLMCVSCAHPRPNPVLSCVQRRCREAVMLRTRRTTHQPGLIRGGSGSRGQLCRCNHGYTRQVRCVTLLFTSILKSKTGSLPTVETVRRKIGVVSRSAPHVTSDNSVHCPAFRPTIPERFMNFWNLLWTSLALLMTMMMMAWEPPHLMRCLMPSFGIRQLHRMRSLRLILCRPYQLVALNQDQHLSLFLLP